MGLIFTKGDLKEVSEEVAKYKVNSFFFIFELYFTVFILLHSIFDSVFFFSVFYI